jgi:hypothetical protein
MDSASMTVCDAPPHPYLTINFFVIPGSGSPHIESSMGKEQEEAP